MSEAEEAIKRVLELCEYWDSLAKSEFSVTKQIREKIGPVVIEQVMNPGKTIELDGSQLHLEFPVIVYGEPCD